MSDILSGGGGEAKPAAARTKDDEEQAKEPEYKLLRYFDFDVDPEKKYAYRVFLLLYNPNHGMDATVLEEAEQAKHKIIGPIPNTEIRDNDNKIIWIETDPHYAPWSKHCTSGSVRGDMRMLGGSVAVPKAPQEINGEVRILRWIKKSGLNATFAKSGLVRGTVLNFDKAQMKVPGGEKTTQNLATNGILVDLMGGEVLQPPKGEYKGLNSPGLILVLDESGNLVMHDEVAEDEEWEKASTVPVPETPDHHGGRHRRHALAPVRGSAPREEDQRRRAWAEETQSLGRRICLSIRFVSPAIT